MTHNGRELLDIHSVTTATTQLSSLFPTARTLQPERRVAPPRAGLSSFAYIRSHCTKPTSEAAISLVPEIPHGREVSYCPVDSAA